VSRVEDGRTLALADGSEVHLAGIEVPQLPAPQDFHTVPGRHGAFRAA